MEEGVGVSVDRCNRRYFASRTEESRGLALAAKVGQRKGKKRVFKFRGISEDFRRLEVNSKSVGNPQVGRHLAKDIQVLDYIVKKPSKRKNE